jgi:hypothetical protein
VKLCIFAEKKLKSFCHLSIPKSRKMMKKHACLLLFMTLVLFAPARRSIAQEQDPNPAAIRSAGTVTEYPGAGSLVIYDSTDVDVQETGLSYVLMHRLIKVLTPAGAKDLRSMNFGYDPLSAAVEIRSVRIYRHDGGVEIVGPERVSDYAAPARAIYWGAREKSVETGRLDVGDAVETVVFRKGFTYALLADQEDDSKFIPPMRGHFYDIVEFWSSTPVKEKVYRIAMPKDKPLQSEVYNGEVSSSVHFSTGNAQRFIVDMNPAGKMKETAEKELHPTSGFYTHAGKTVYCWYKRNIAPFKSEPGMVAPSDVATKLLVSTSPDWYAKSVWFNKVNEDFKSFAVTPEVQDITDKLLKGVGDELEKISILNHWTAEEIRYSGISMGTGEGYTLHPGSMTFLDRCGVCKDKAGMLVTLLRAAGFESYPAMTMAGSRIDAIPADQFNHSVAVVKRANGHWMLLDPTWIPGVREMWSSAEQQQEFLMGIPGGADIMTTPVSPAENHYWKLNGSSALKEDGTLEGEFTLTAEGQSDANIRRAFVRSYTSSWKEYLPNVMYAVSPRAEITGLKMGDPTDLKDPISISVTYRIPRYAVAAGGTLLFTPLLARNPFTDGAMSGELQTDTGMTSRKYGFRARCSKLVEIHETVKLPAKMKALVLPKYQDVKGKSASFSAAYELKGATLDFRLTHRLEKRVYEAGDWPEFREALIGRLQCMNTPLIFSK